MQHDQKHHIEVLSHIINISMRICPCHQVFQWLIFGSQGKQLVPISVTNAWLRKHFCQTFCCVGASLSCCYDCRLCIHPLRPVLSRIPMPLTYASVFVFLPNCFITIYLHFKVSCFLL